MALYYLICFIIGLSLGTISKLLYLNMITTLDIKNIADAFQAVCFGIGAIISAFTVLPVVLKMVKRSQLVKKFRSMYPVEKLNIAYVLAYDPTRPKGHVYLMNIQANTKHHIENPDTMKDLFFDWGQVQTITVEEWDKYTLSNNIDTKTAES